MIVKAGILNTINQKISYTDVRIERSEEEVLVRLTASSLNRRDLWIQEGLYARIQLPCIPGSDGCGWLGGQEVILLPSINWGESGSFQSKNFQVLGMPHHGTCSEYIAIDPQLIYSKPNHLDHIEAASLPLSGLTAWRALMTQGHAQPGQKILITGIGGGVASFVLLFAVAHGMEVYVTSGTQDKIDKAVSLGAKNGVNYKDSRAFEQLSEMASGFDVIIDSAGGPDFHKLLRLANYGGHVVMYGGTLGNIDHINPQNLFWKQITIKGSTMGSPKEFREMLDFIGDKKVKPVIDRVFPLSEIDEAFNYMRSGNHFGKIVLDHTR